MLSGCSRAAEASVEIDVEFVEGLLPSLGPAGSGLPCRVECHHGEVDAFEGGLLGREVPAGADGFADAFVHALDRIGRAHDPADLTIEPEERHELRPRVLP